MTTTASAIKDAAITNLSAASVIGGEQVSTNYSVMESTAACCAVVNVIGFVSNPMTFGNNRRGTATLLIEAKLKDTGDPVSLMNNTHSFMDKIIASLESDDTLQGTVEGIERIEATRDPNIAETIGGATWLPIDITVEMSWWD
jgi:hypothetical protein